MKCLTRFAVMLSIAALLTTAVAHATSPPHVAVPTTTFGGSSSPTSHPSKHGSQPPAAQPSNNVSQVSQTKSSASSLSKSAAKSDAAARSGSSSASQSSSTGGHSSATGGSSKQAQRQSSTNESSGNASAQTGAISVTGPAASTANGDQEVTIHGDETTYEAPKIPVSTAVAGGTNTTAGCRYSVGAGGQATILGLSFGIGRKDRDCERVALAEMMYDRGNPDAGDAIMCRVRELREAFGADCLAMLARSRPAVPAQPTERQLRMREEFERGEYRK